MNGFENLFAMEIDPTSAIQEMVEQCASQYHFFRYVNVDIKIGSGLERHDGLYDAGFGICDSRCG